MGWLVALLITVPILEIYVIVQVGQEIGAVPTILVLLAVSVAGAWLVKHEGRRAWHALQDALQSGQMPARELADAALLLVGGVLLLTPGFVTDAVGLCFVLPFTRPWLRRMFAGVLGRRMLQPRSESSYSRRRHGVHQIYHEDDR